eukprot:Rhum_TRINITY_DN14673_c20_g1::Rhum_TRINITY_DN14673_c20_g1_i1::g.108200::m.108200/K08337/ATG7; ubiquitin-like modifier-activating enzyme ATG7
MSAARFEAFAPFPKVEFWAQLEKKKIHEMRLSAASVPVTGFFKAARSPNCVEKLELTGESFAAPNAGAYEYTAQGTVTNFNTIEEFRALDTKKTLAGLADALYADMESNAYLANPRLLFAFHVFSFADLKAHVFHSRAVMPILSPPPADLIKSSPQHSVSAAKSPVSPARLQTLWNDARGVDGPVRHDGIFCLRNAGGDADALALAPLSSLSAEEGVAEALGEGRLVVCVVDACGAKTHMGWIVRNLLVALNMSFGARRVTVLSLRESSAAGVADSVFATFTMGANVARSALRAVGWDAEKPPVDLSSSMDPSLLAKESARLNLSLMKWRMTPSLDLDLIASQKCLVVGSGTLGCGVARNLMKWGVYDFTMIDRGCVSFSNPVRQSLFVHDDAVQKKNKARAAAEACKRIYPLCDAKFVEMSVPMPGHAVSSDQQEAEVRATVAQFEALIEAHDVIFLLTDSRESRWLPTMLGAKHKKIVMNAALGFDSYVAMRHGFPGGKDRLACYFCTDVTSPSDSLSDRTLDQQCTVTRPGVSDMAAAQVVELMTSVISHPDGINAAARDGTAGALGLVAHQIRACLSDNTHHVISGPSYPQCVACSDKVLEEYEKRGFEFVKEVLNDPGVLTHVTGIQAMIDKMEEDGDMGVIDFNSDDESEE